MSYFALLGSSPNKTGFATFDFKMFAVLGSGENN